MFRKGVTSNAYSDSTKQAIAATDITVDTIVATGKEGNLSKVACSADMRITMPLATAQSIGVAKRNVLKNNITYTAQITEDKGQLLVSAHGVQDLIDAYRTRLALVDSLSQGLLMLDKDGNAWYVPGEFKKGEPIGLFNDNQLSGGMVTLNPDCTAGSFDNNGTWRQQGKEIRIALDNASYTFPNAARALTGICTQTRQQSDQEHGTSAVTGVDVRAAPRFSPFLDARGNITRNNCHMGECNWTKWISVSLVGQNNSSDSLVAEIQSGTSEHSDNKYPVSPQGVGISWDKASNHIILTCSYDKPTVSSNGDNDVLPLSPSGLSGATEYMASLYFEACHSFSGSPYDAIKQFGYNVSAD
jgi:hypothetical protein